MNVVFNEGMFLSLVQSNPPGPPSIVGTRPRPPATPAVLESATYLPVADIGLGWGKSQQVNGVHTPTGVGGCLTTSGLTLDADIRGRRR